MPTASIIVPAFNVERTIARTLSTLLAQTFDDFEIVIVARAGTRNAKSGDAVVGLRE